MRSRKEGRNYVIQYYNEKPIKINRKRTDKACLTIINLTRKLTDLIKKVYEKDPVLCDTLFNVGDEPRGNYSYDTDVDSIVYGLEKAIQNFQDFYDIVSTHNDEIRKPETYLCFEDLGYKWNMSLSCYRKNEWPQVYTKTIEDTNERSIEEEIWIFKDRELTRRIRTTLWDTTDYGKSSRSITYKKKPLTKKIKLAAANLLKYGGKE